MTNERFLALVRDSFSALEGNSVYLESEGVTVPVLEPPLVGFAPADDPLFTLYPDPEVIGEDFRPPRDWMRSAESVAAFFFPFSPEVRRRSREETALTCPAWNAAYGGNFKLVDAFLDILVPRLEAEGAAVFQPNRDPSLVRKAHTVLRGGEEDHHYSVSWSNRHAMFAAGLGTFGIHRHLITEKGCCGTTASFLTDAKLTPTPRNYTDVYEYCIRCGACMDRCPAGAISLEYMRNLKKCAAQGGLIRERFGSGFCGKCLTGIPCEDRNPSRP